MSAIAPNTNNPGPPNTSNVVLPDEHWCPGAILYGPPLAHVPPFFSITSLMEPKIIHRQVANPTEPTSSTRPTTDSGSRSSRLFLRAGLCARGSWTLVLSRSSECRRRVVAITEDGEGIHDHVRRAWRAGLPSIAGLALGAGLAFGPAGPRTPRWFQASARTRRSGNDAVSAYRSFGWPWQLSLG